eukprot:gene10121-1451_t
MPPYAVALRRGGGGATLHLPTFTITAGFVPTWTPTSSGALKCFEDASPLPSTGTSALCKVRNFFTNLNDNNRGRSTFATAGCPASGGGSADPTRCWYHITSADPRWQAGAAFFATRPLLTATPTACQGLCVSDLCIGLAPNANTACAEGGGGGVLPDTGPVVLSIVIQDAAGNRAAAATVSLTVVAVNDAPVIMSSQVVNPLNSRLDPLFNDTSLQTVALFSGALSGPANACDENAQVLCGGGACACSVGNPGMFAARPEVRLSLPAATGIPAGQARSLTAFSRFPPGYIGTLRYRLAAGLAGYEFSTVSCAVSDGALSTSTERFTITAVTGENRCAPWEFPVGYEGGGGDGCADGRHGFRLSAGGDPSCSLRCCRGYNCSANCDGRTNGSLTCAARNDGDPATTAMLCTPATCWGGPTAPAPNVNYTECNR